MATVCPPRPRSGAGRCMGIGVHSRFASYLGGGGRGLATHDIDGDPGSEDGGSGGLQESPEPFGDPSTGLWGRRDRKRLGGELERTQWLEPDAIGGFVDGEPRACPAPATRSAPTRCSRQRRSAPGGVGLGRDFQKRILGDPAGRIYPKPAGALPPSTTRCRNWRENPRSIEVRWDRTAAVPGGLYWSAMGCSLPHGRIAVSQA